MARTDDGGIAAFQLRIEAADRDELDRLISKWKSKGVLPNRSSRNDWIVELVRRCLDASTAIHEEIARSIASRYG